jgi:peptidoglycan/LPS O-acetylase OafA/YrhL
VNVVFFMTWRKLTSVGLSVLIGAGAIGLIACACAFSKINGGVTTDSFWQGFPRVIFSFFLGVAIFRAGLSDRVKAGRSALGPLIVLLLVALNARAWLPACWYAASDLVLVLFIFPGVLVFMASIDLSPRWSKGAEILGGASYSVYLLQDPLANILAGLSLVLFGRNILSLAPYAGLVFFPLILISSYYIWRWFEIPAKNRLLKLWKR